jgi:hypothetical protein
MQSKALNATQCEAMQSKAIAQQLLMHSIAKQHKSDQQKNILIPRVSEVCLRRRLPHAKHILITLCLRRPLPHAKHILPSACGGLCHTPNIYYPLLAEASATRQMQTGSLILAARPTQSKGLQRNTQQQQAKQRITKQHKAIKNRVMRIIMPHDAISLNLPHTQKFNPPHPETVTCYAFSFRPPKAPPPIARYITL